VSIGLPNDERYSGQAGASSHVMEQSAEVFPLGDGEVSLFLDMEKLSPSIDEVLL
jgi:hypothetical protein